MDFSAQLPTYLEFASELTGVSQKVVEQAEQGASFLQQYANMADAAAGAGTTQKLLTLYFQQRQLLTAEQVVQSFLDKTYDKQSPNPTWPYSLLVRNLAKFLLLGVWFDPTNPDDEGTTPTSAIYAQGLVWLVAQAQPTGVSKLAYGHWANPPPPLKQLIG
jgi:hypothetical protein